MIRYRVAPDVSYVANEKGVVLLDLRSGKFYSLSGVASVIFGEMVKNKQPAEIVTELEITYQQPRSRLEADLNVFLSELIQKGVCLVADE